MYPTTKPTPRRIAVTTGFELITPLILSHIVVFLFQFRTVDIITISRAVFEFLMVQTQKKWSQPARAGSRINISGGLSPFLEGIG